MDKIYLDPARDITNLEDTKTEVIRFSEAIDEHVSTSSQSDKPTTVLIKKSFPTLYTYIITNSATNAP